MAKILKYTLFALAVSVMSVFCSCSDDPDTPTPTETTRTILVYMVANNSLGGSTETSGFDYADLKEMETAAAAGDLNGCRWLIYHASKYKDPVLKELTKNGFKELKTYSNDTYSVALSRMREVFADMKAIAPAEEYALILWSHASGWQQNGLLETTARTARPLTYGDDRGRAMNITSLRSAVEDQNFEFIYADVCFFGSVEVAYELRHATPYLIGSESRLPGAGMPYDLNMKYFTAATPDLLSAAQTTYNYYASSSDPTDWCTISLIDMGKLDALAAETRAVYQTCDYPAGYRPQKMDDYGTCYYFDLQHFVNAMNPESYYAWADALKNAVIYQANTPYLMNGTRIDCHCGLSTYIIPDENSRNFRNYNTLEWYDDVAQYQPMP